MTMTATTNEAQSFSINASSVTEYYALLKEEQKRVEAMRLEMFLQQIEDCKSAFLDHPEEISKRSFKREKTWLADHVRDNQEFCSKKPTEVRGQAVLVVTPAECLTLFTFEEQGQLAEIIARALITGAAYENLDKTDPTGGKLFPVLSIWAKNEWDSFEPEPEY